MRLSRYARTLQVVLAVLGSAGPAAAQQVTVQITSPLSGALVSGPVAVTARITSDLELQSVSAHVGGASYALTADPMTGMWGTQVDFGPMPYGDTEVAIDATDIHAQTGHAALTVRVDHPPKLILEEPARAQLAMNTVHLRAHCTDDGASPCRIEVYASIYDNTLGPSNIGKWELGADVDETLCLDGNDGKPVMLTIYAWDDANQSTNFAVNVIVNASPNLQVEEAVPGALLDSDPRRLLYRDVTDQTWLRDRTTGQTVAIGKGEATCIVFCGHNCNPCTDRGWLVGSDGALVLSGNDLLESRDGGVLSPVAPAVVGGMFSSATQVRDSHALDSDGVYHSYLFDFASDETTVLPVSCSKLGAQGEVFCHDLGTVSRLSDGGIVLDAGLGLGEFAVEDPLVAYQLSSTSELFLKEGESTTALGVADYRFSLSPHWLAYAVGSGISGNAQVWTRASDGGLAQRTFFGAPAFVEAVGDDGSVIATSGEKRYLVTADQVVDLGVAQGTVFRQDGTWHVIQGNTLLKVSPDAGLPPTTACLAPPDAGTGDDTDPDAGEPSSAQPHHCGCTSTAVPGWCLLAALFLLVRRRA